MIWIEKIFYLEKYFLNELMFNFSFLILNKVGISFIR